MGTASCFRWVNGGRWRSTKASPHALLGKLPSEAGRGEALVADQQDAIASGDQLGELKRWLLRRTTPPEVRDSVWRQLVIRARRDGPAWVVAAAGVAMPGLRAIAGRLAVGYTGDRDDIDAELLAVFVARLHEVDIDAPRVLLRLLWAAERAARKVRYSQEARNGLSRPPRPTMNPERRRAAAR